MAGWTEVCCIYVCVCVCRFLCMHVCMFICMADKYGIQVSAVDADPWLAGLKCLCVCVCVCVGFYVCMYACIYVWLINTAFVCQR